MYIVHTYIYMHGYIRRPTALHVFMHTCIHTYICIHITHIQKFIHIYIHIYVRGTWWSIGRVEAFRLEGRRGFESCSIRHVGTLDKLPVALRDETPAQYIRAVSGALLSSGGLEEALKKWPE